MYGPPQKRHFYLQAKTGDLLGLLALLCTVLVMLSKGTFMKQHGHWLRGPSHIDTQDFLPLRTFWVGLKSHEF